MARLHGTSLKHLEIIDMPRGSNIAILTCRTFITTNVCSSVYKNILHWPCCRELNAPKNTGFVHNHSIICSLETPDSFNIFLSKFGGNNFSPIRPWGMVTQQQIGYHTNKVVCPTAQQSGSQSESIICLASHLKDIRSQIHHPKRQALGFFTL